MGRKWNNIKEKKALLDKKKGQNYTKVLKEVTMAAKNGGGDDPNSNFLLKIALQKAKEYSVPKDNVDRAIKKGIGGDAVNFIEVHYEGYGADGVAIFVEATTDNVTRTVANIRNAFVKHGGSLGKEGCLQFIFERVATFEILISSIGIDLNIDDLTLELIDAGAEDVFIEEDYLFIKTEVDKFKDLSDKLEELNIVVENSSLQRIPLSDKKVDRETFIRVNKTLSMLEADEDVQEIYHNMIFEE